MGETSDSPKQWWETVPGILAGVAAVITALGGLLALYIRSHPANSLDPATAPPREAIFLSDQAPSDIPSEPHGGLGRDKAYWTDRIVLNGRQIAKALVMHPNLGSPAVVGYGLTVPYSRFEAIVGLIEPRCLNRGSAEFKVLVDGDTRFTSGILRFGQQESVSVPLQSAKRLTLEVSDGGDGNECDQAAWTEPRLIPGGT